MWCVWGGVGGSICQTTFICWQNDNHSQAHGCFCGTLHDDAEEILLQSPDFLTLHNLTQDDLLNHISLPISKIGQVPLDEFQQNLQKVIIGHSF